jgi:hypothetical protein
MTELSVDAHGRTIYEFDGLVLDRFIQSKAFVQVLLGPIGSGKSKACCLKAYKIAAEQKPGPDGIRRVRVAVVRNSYPLLRTTTVRTWLDTFPETIYGRLMWSQPPRQVVKWGDIQLEADFIALDDDADVAKLRSGEFTFFWINEIQYMPKILFDEMTSRVGRYPAVKDGGATWRGIIADGNVPDPDHWLALSLGLSPPPEGMPEDEQAALAWPSTWDSFIQPAGLIEVRDGNGRVVAYEENPNAENQKWLPEDYYLRLVENKSRSWVQSRVLNQVALVSSGAPVWLAFRQEVHVAKEVLKPVPGHEVWVGADFGRSPAVVFAQAVNNRVSILAEMQGYNESAVTFAPRVKRFLESHFRGFQYQAFGDPKGRDRTQTDERTAYDVFRANGIDMRASPIKQNLIETRIAAVDSILNQLSDGRPRLQISPNCRTLIGGMSGGYCYERKMHSSEVKTEPSKNRFSHLCDALQYVLIAMGEGRTMIGLQPLGDLRPKQFYRGHRSMRRVFA